MAFVNPLEISIENSEVEVFLDADKTQSTGLILNLLPPYAKEVKAVDRKHQATAAKAVRKGDDAVDHVFETLEDSDNEKVMAHVVGWRWLDGVDEVLSSVPYSEKQLREYLKAVPFGDAIRSCVMRHVGKPENFHARQQTS